MRQQKPKPTVEVPPRLEMVEDRPTLTITLPSGWARAGLAGVEAALLGWAVPALLALLLFLKDAQNPWLRDHLLTEAGKVGTELWALTLGAEITLGGTKLSLIPLTWTAAQILVLRILLLRGRRFSAAAQWAAVPSFALTAATIVLASGQTTSWASIFPGALLIPLVAGAWAVVNQTTLLFPWLKSGLRVAAVWVGLTGLVGLSAVLVSTLVSWDEIIETTSLITAESSPVLPALLVLAPYFFTFGAWALAWLAGPGFVVDDGQLHSPTSAPETFLAGIPAGPLIPTTAPGDLVMLIPITLGLLLGFGTAWFLATKAFTEALWTTLTALGLYTAFAFTYLSASTGALGQEKLAHIGPVFSAWLVLTGLVGVLASALALLFHPTTFAAAKSLGSHDNTHPESAVSPVSPVSTESSEELGSEHGQ